MHRHAERVGGLLAAHGFDSFGDGPHIFPRPHRGEGAEQQAQHQCKILGNPVTLLSFSLASAQPYPDLRQSAQYPMLDEFEIASSEPGDPNRAGKLR